MLNSGEKNRNVLIILISLVIIVGFTVYGVKSAYPSVRNLSQEEFAVSRVMSHLEIIALQPSPVGSLEKENVKEYLYKALTELGVNPEIQRTSVINPRWQTGAVVENIVARVPGKASSKAILLMANYDSVPNSPGASSNKAAVASILETLRVLLAGEQLKNDVIILLADGGNIGSLGTIAFVEQHPWMKDVGLFLSPEAKGLSGPSVLFGTSRGNSKIIAEYGKAIPRPIANSFNYELYRMTGADNSSGVLSQTGIPGLNLAYVENSTYHHTALDNLENLESRSVQHQGTNLLHLVQHFGNLALDDSNQIDQIYFDLFGLSFVHYPVTWVAHLLTIALILYGFVGWHGVKRARLSIKGTAIGILLFLVIGVLLGMLMGFVGGLFVPHHPLYQYVPLSNGLWYLLGLIAFTVTIFVLLYTWAFNKVAWLDLNFGAQAVWLLLTTVISLFLPGTSYFFVWPLLLSLLGTLVIIIWENPSWMQKTIALLLSFVPVMVLWPMMIWNLFNVTEISFVGILMFMVVMACGLLLPTIKSFAEVDWRIVPLVTVCLLLLSIVTIKLSTGITPEQPGMNSLFYYGNADTNEGLWVSIDNQLDEFTKQFIPSDYSEGNLNQLIPYEDVPIIKGTAGFNVELPIVVELVNETINEEIKIKHLLIKVLQESTSLLMHIEPDLVAGEVEIEGNMVSWEDYWPVFRFYAIPPEGISLSVPTYVDRQFSITVLSKTLGLPEIMGQHINRPDDLISAPTPITDTTVISKTYHFD